MHTVLLMEPWHEPAALISGCMKDAGKFRRHPLSSVVQTVNRFLHALRTTRAEIGNPTRFEL